jgi:phosphoglycerate dehydrogenase-like enzyme
LKILLASDCAEALRERARTLLEASGAGGEVLVLEADGSVAGDATGLEVVLFSPSVPQHPAAMAALLRLLEDPAIRWIQGPGAGVDHPLWQGFLDRGIRLTNASGIHAEPIAQYIFTYVLFWERKVARHLAQQRDRHWEIIRSGDLGNKTLGIIGYGGIGQAAARIAKAFGMRTLGSRRTETADAALDRFVPLDALAELLGASDYVLLSMPYNDATRGMIGARELEAMRSDAVLINVARGGVVDEPALIEALRARRIRGASLDVTCEEPLPKDSPLWELDNCVLTPHDAGYSPLGDERLGALFLENLERYLSGQKMLNEIETTGIAHG